MAAVHIEKVMEKDGEIKITGLPFKKGERVELTLSSEAAEASQHGIKASELLRSGLVGIWKNRDDIKDSSAFARQLREKAQHRWR